MKKNVADQKVFIFAWDTVNDQGKVGYASSITAKLSKDGGVLTSTSDEFPTELNATDAPGVYYFNLSQNETNCDQLVLYPFGGVGVQIEPVFIDLYDETSLTTALASILADTGTDGVAISAGTMEAIADVLIQRDMAHSDGLAAEHSLYSEVMSRFKTNRSGAVWTIFETDGITIHITKTLSTDSEADPIIGVS